MAPIANRRCVARISASCDYGAAIEISFELPANHLTDFLVYQTTRPVASRHRPDRETLQMIQAPSRP
jgi:hypothetical protein